MPEPRMPDPRVPERRENEPRVPEPRDMSLAAAVERLLALHLAYHPVDATFMGFAGHDHALPAADEEATARELADLRALEADARDLPPGATAEERIETGVLRSHMRVAIAELEERPRHHNPSWYMGETAFGLVSLMLPREGAGEPDAFRQRLEAIPRFLREGERRLAGRAVPADWSTRAQREGAAVVRLLERGVRKHPMWSDRLEPHAATAATAVRSFVASLQAAQADATAVAPRGAASAGTVSTSSSMPAAGATQDPIASLNASGDPASGEAYLEFMMREAHHLPYSAAEAEALAFEGFQQARADLVTLATELDPTSSWREQLADLDLQHPELADVVPSYERTHARAMRLADEAGLVTPASEYGLRFETLPAWAQEVAGDLYFLFYRSPAAERPSSGSVYWVFPPGADHDAYLRSQSYATVKITHAVHHGSIGHHTQNARARASDVRLGRVAGTDCASGIAMLAGGTLIEGWACYVQDLMLEADGFYQPHERLLLKHAELRNTAMCLADIRLHRGTWGLTEMRAFYSGEVGIAANRAWSESTRNSMYPSSRLMYWLGTRTIKQLRAELGGDPRTFHDELLSYGSVPVHDVAVEMRAAAHAG